MTPPAKTPTLRVLYDGNCGLCCRMAGLLRLLDWRGQLKLINALDRAAVEAEGLGHLADADLMQDMHVAWQGPKDPPDWQVAKGYASYQQIAWRVPLLWPLLLVIYLPPVAALGRWVYRRVADSRSCNIPQP